jgi:hypothetical protein
VVSQVVAALKETGVAFETFDILSDEAIRQGLKEYSNWPTYPQLYVNRYENPRISQGSVTGDPDPSRGGRAGVNL